MTEAQVAIPRPRAEGSFDTRDRHLVGRKSKIRDQTQQDQRAKSTCINERFLYSTFCTVELRQSRAMTIQNILFCPPIPASLQPVPALVSAFSCCFSHGAISLAARLVLIDLLSSLMPARYRHSPALSGAVIAEEEGALVLEGRRVP